MVAFADLSDYVWQLQAMDDASHRLHTFSRLSRVTTHDALIMIALPVLSSKFASYSDDCMLLLGLMPGALSPYSINNPRVSLPFSLFAQRIV